MTTAPFPIAPAPGIQRDGTRLDATACIDALWCRWQRGKPRKMGGYRNVSDTLAGISRALHVHNKGETFVHSGHAGGIDRVQIGSDGSVAAYANRSPSGFALNDDNQWQFDVLYDPVVTNAAKIIAHATPSLRNLDSATKTSIYIGDATDTAQLTAIPSITVSGGILAMPPYLVCFGSDGEFNWSALNNPNDFTTTGASGSGQAFVAKQKLVKGLPLRGGPGASPSGLIWGVNALVRVFYTGGTTVWGFDTLTENNTMLSANSVIEYDGVYFWPGADRFMMFNGTVRELPNIGSVNWFYDNINPLHAGKTFAFRNTRFGEIWWCFPFGDATEPSHALIYNVRENCWYDTALPGQGRSAAASAQIYRYPLMAGVEKAPSNAYKLWQHEYGKDMVDGSIQGAVRSYFETNDISLPFLPQNAVNKSLHVAMVEPDFEQQGELSLTIVGNANARSAARESNTVTFPAPPAETGDQIVKLKDTHRQLRFRFESNTPGGDYQMGKVIAHVQPADGTMVQ